MLTASLSCRFYLNSDTQYRSGVRWVVRVFTDTIMIACLLAALWGVGAEAFCLTVFFVMWILRIALPVATRWLESEPDTVIYFAPWVRWNKRLFICLFFPGRSRSGSRHRHCHRRHHSLSTPRRPPPPTTSPTSPPPPLPCTKGNNIYPPAPPRPPPPTKPPTSLPPPPFTTTIH